MKGAVKLKKKIGDLTLREAHELRDEICEGKSCGECAFQCNSDCNFDEEIEVPDAQ